MGPPLSASGPQRTPTWPPNVQKAGPKPFYAGSFFASKTDTLPEEASLGTLTLIWVLSSSFLGYPVVNLWVPLAFFGII